MARLVLLAAVALLASGCTLPARPDAIGAPVVPPSARGNLTLTMLDVGQGEALLLTTPGGLHVLYEGGPRARGDEVVAFLRAQRVASLDLLVASHAHEDHLGGFLAVLGALPVTRVLDSGFAYGTATQEDFLDEVATLRIPIEEPRRGARIALDPALRITVLNPPATLYPEDREDSVNLNNLALLVSYGACDLLLPGDAPQEAERAFAAMLPNVEVLQVGHHGSADSTGPALLAAARPDLALISAGAGNPYGHPQRATLDALEAADARVLRTDLQGSLQVTMDGERFAAMGPAGFEPAICAL